MGLVAGNMFHCKVLFVLLRGDSTVHLWCLAVCLQRPGTNEQSRAIHDASRSGTRFAAPVRGFFCQGEPAGGGAAQRAPQPAGVAGGHVRKNAPRCPPVISIVAV